MRKWKKSEIGQCLTELRQKSAWAFLWVLILSRCHATRQIEDSGESSFSKTATAHRTRGIAKRLRQCGIFNDRFIANFLENVIGKEFWKEANNKAFIKRSKNAGFCNSELHDFASLCAKADKDLFTITINSPGHVLHPLLPPLCSRTTIWETDRTTDNCQKVHLV